MRHSHLSPPLFTHSHFDSTPGASLGRTQSHGGVKQSERVKRCTKKIDLKNKYDDSVADVGRMALIYFIIFENAIDRDEMEC